LSPSALDAVLKRDGLVVAASLAGLCLLSWLFLIHLALQMDTMEGMAARMMSMPVEDGISALLEAALSPGAATIADAAYNFVLVALMWAVMMVGMMIPAAAPTILLFSALERKRSAAGMGGRTASFVAGYFVIWTTFSVAAAAAQTALSHTGLMSMQMATTSALLGGAVFIAAGLFELTPAKNQCLVRCRSPLEWIPRHMQPGRAGALRMGMQHGAYCLGCCWALMLLLFVGGVMNLVWVAALAAVVLLQKVLPGGMRLARFAGVALITAGLAIAAGPFFSA
jgi:predicted metal-binding membrane protein